MVLLRKYLISYQEKLFKKLLRTDANPLLYKKSTMDNIKILNSDFCENISGKGMFMSKEAQRRANRRVKRNICFEENRWQNSRQKLKREMQARWV